MNLDDIYNYAEQNNIDILEFCTHNKKAFCIDDNNSQFIAIDYTKINSTREEKDILAEEIAHLKYKLLYFLTDYKNPNFVSNVSKAEAQAKRKAAEMLIPLSDLLNITSKTTNLWEIAEALDTSEDTVRIAINNYTQKGLLKSWKRQINSSQ